MDIIKKLFVVLVLLTLSTVGYAEEVVSRLEALEKMFEEAKKLRKEHKNHSYDAANEISEMFDKVEKEYQTQGYSNLVNQVRHEFIQEQDLKNKEVMQALIDDPTLTKDQKRPLLKEYIYGFKPSKELKDKYIKDLSDISMDDMPGDEIIEMKLSIDKVKLLNLATRTQYQITHRTYARATFCDV